MNKLFSFKSAVLTALLIVGGCAKEPVPSQVYVEEIPQVTFTATMEGGLDSRTTLGGDDLKTVFWSGDDAIKVYSGSNSGKMQIEGISGGVATFSGNLVAGRDVQGYKYWAIYPYTCVSSFSNGVFTASLPSRQHGLVTSFGEDVSFTIARANPADDGTTSFHFKNACSGIRFRLDENTLGGERISRVSIFANDGESLAGMFTTSFDSDGTPVTEPSDKSVSSVTLVPATGNSFAADTWYYMITLPVELRDGFTMVLEGSGVVRTFTYSKSLAFNRSQFRTVTLTSSNAPKVTRQEEQFGDYYITSSAERSYISQARTAYVNDLGINGYTTSVVGSGSSSQYPDPIPFKWTATNAVKMEFSDDPSFSSSTVITFSSGTTSFNVYNLIPEVTYYYRLYDSSGSVIGGLRSITPKGPVRTIKVGGVDNFRDLGGWTGEDGKTLRFGKIYRGANIDAISDKQTFINLPSGSYTGSSPYYIPLGIKHDIDLRGYDNGNAKKVISEINWVNFKVKQFMYGSQSSNGSNRPGGGGSSSSDSYDVSKTGVTAARYQCALRYIINCIANDEPVFFHCIGGADRTGTLAFLIEALLGVSELDMNIDYELTSYYSSRKRTNTSDRPFKYLVRYLYSFEGSTLQEKVTTWAMTEFTDTDATYSKKPLTLDEINTLKELMLE